MSETDAVRPTGETGARCPWCDVPMEIAEVAGKQTTVYRIRCPNGDCEQYAVYPSRKSAQEVYGQMPAARPLPDFPAWLDDDEIKAIAYLAAQEWKREVTERNRDNGERGSVDLGEPSAIHVECMEDFAVRVISRVRAPAPARPAADPAVTPGLSELERLRAENEAMRDFIARNCIDSDFPEPAPALPAAAGLTEIPGYEDPTIHAICAEIEYMTISNANSEDIVRHVIRRALGDRRFLIALGTDDILSSRATGAEVEIPELTNDEIVALCKETVRLVRLAYARRHATILGKP